MSYTKTGNPVELLRVVKNCITSLILQGKTNQPGTGDPNPTNIRPISGVGEYRTDGYYADVVITDENGAHTITAGPLSAPLYDGDTLDFVSGEVIRNNGKVEIPAVISQSHIYSNMFYLDGFSLPFPFGTGVCSHYNYGLYALGKIGITAGGNSIVYRPNGDYTPDQTGLNNFITYVTGQHAAGTPVTIVYRLASPTTETVPISEPITNAAGTVTLSAENTLQVTVGVMSEEVSPPTPLSEPMVNGKPFSAYGGAMLFDYTVGGTEINNDYFQGRNRTSFTQLATVFKMRKIKLSVVFSGPDLEAVTLQKSLFDAACFGKSELFLPDGFFYTVVTNSLGDAAIVGIGETVTKVKATYEFTGLRHKPLVTVSLPAGGGKVNCGSTTPLTDCRLSCTVTTAAATYLLGGATFNDVTAGEPLVFDGIEKRILRNGAPGAANVNWTQFPALTPGENNIVCADAVTVEFYPTFL